jgi:diguanylate cyclase
MPSSSAAARSRSFVRRTASDGRGLTDQNNVRLTSSGRHRRRWAGAALVVMIALLGTGGSALAARGAHDAEQRYGALLMDRHSGDLGQAITTEIQRYEDTLTDIAVALGAQTELTAADFTWIIDKMNIRRMPGATSLSLVVSTPQKGIGTLQEYWRGVGATGLTLRPGARTSRGEHMFAVLARSFDGEPVTAGIDLAEVPEAASTLRQAALVGDFAVGRSHILSDDRGLPAAEQQRSFTFAVPVYRLGGAFRGWLVIGVHGRDLLTETLRTYSHGAVTAGLNDTTDRIERVIADTSDDTTPGSGALTRTTYVTAGLRTWELEVYPTRQLLDETDRGTVSTTFAVGITITGLLAALIGLLAGARNRAMVKVDAATGALRDDIERRKEVENRLRDRECELERMALHDPLTGLTNRAGLNARLADTVGIREDLALLLFDLDDFKLVNDVYGHAGGDTMLIEFAQILQASIRPEDTAARMGGDEFVVLLTDMLNAEDAVAVARRVLSAATATPVRLDGDTVTVRASIGVATSRPGDTPKELLRRADVAMYLAKQLGTHGVQLHHPSMVDRRTADARLAEDLAGALQRGELYVLYQPLVDLTDGHPVGVEALVRWEHPRLGLVPPMQFIPLAERNGTIDEIGLFVLEEACREVTAWDGLYLSVNLSPRQLQVPTLVRDVLAVLARTSVTPDRLVLEITESALVDESAGIAMLRAFQDHGIRVAIDDFGTGYSSLRYLTRLPVDILKIDRSFVAELNGTPEGSAITEAILRLSQVLHLTTVAEGVETEAQAAELRLLGCGIGQGYLFAKPLGPRDLPALLGTELERSGCAPSEGKTGV